jgi:Autotransporter beta-domain
MGDAVMASAIEHLRPKNRTPHGISRLRIGLRIALLSSVVLAAAPASVLAQNPIVNGGFTTNGGNNSPSAPPWTAVPGTSPFLVCLSDVACQGPPVIAHNGVAYVDLTFNTGGAGDVAAMAQSVTLPRSGPYLFTFYYQNLLTSGGCCATPGLTASVGGIVAFNNPHGTANGWTLSSSIVSLTAGGTTVQFSGVWNAALDLGIDDVSLTYIPPQLGEVGAGFALGGFEAGTLFLGVLTSPYSFGSNGGTGPHSFATEQAPRSAVPDDVAHLYDAIVGKTADGAAALNFPGRWSAWGIGYGGAGSIGGNALVGSHDTSASVYGYAGGMDYRISPDNIVGFALGGGGTNWGVSDGLGSGTSHMFQAGLYSFNRWGPVYLSAAVADSAHEANTTRTVTIAGADTLAANFNANVISARVEGGYRYGIGTSGVTPYAAAQGQWMHVPSYSENATAGSSALALSYGSQNPKDLRSELGSWLDCGVLFDGGMLLTLYGRGAWAHDTNGFGTATVFFQSLPGTGFLVTAAKPDNNSALATAGAKYSLGNGWSLLAQFDGQFSGNTSIYAGTGTVRYTW